jgi:hypothetical protein
MNCALCEVELVDVDYAEVWAGILVCEHCIERIKELR